MSVPGLDAFIAGLVASAADAARAEGYAAGKAEGYAAGKADAPRIPTGDRIVAINARLNQPDIAGSFTAGELTEVVVVRVIDELVALRAMRDQLRERIYGPNGLCQIDLVGSKSSAVEPPHMSMSPEDTLAVDLACGRVVVTETPIGVAALRVGMTGPDLVAFDIACSVPKVGESQEDCGKCAQCIAYDSLVCQCGCALPDHAVKEPMHCCDCDDPAKCAAFSLASWQGGPARPVLAPTDPKPTTALGPVMPPSLDARPGGAESGHLISAGGVTTMPPSGPGYAAAERAAAMAKAASQGAGADQNVTGAAAIVGGVAAATVDRVLSEQSKAAKHCMNPDTCNPDKGALGCICKCGYCKANPLGEKSPAEINAAMVEAGKPGGVAAVTLPLGEARCASCSDVLTPANSSMPPGAAKPVHIGCKGPAEPAKPVVASQPASVRPDPPPFGLATDLFGIPWTPDLSVIVHSADAWARKNSQPPWNYPEKSEAFVALCCAAEGEHMTWFALMTRAGELDARLGAAISGPAKAAPPVADQKQTVIPGSGPVGEAPKPDEKGKPLPDKWAPDGEMITLIGSKKLDVAAVVAKYRAAMAGQVKGRWSQGAFRQWFEADTKGAVTA